MQKFTLTQLAGCQCEIRDRANSLAAAHTISADRWRVHGWSCNQRRKNNTYSQCFCDKAERERDIPKKDQSFLWCLLTAACARSRSHRRSQTSGSRNIHCTCWPETRCCRRWGGELRWSALSPPWQSLLPALSASGVVRTPRQEKRRKESPRKAGKVSPPPGDVSSSSSLDARITYSGASWRCGRVFFFFSLSLSPPLFFRLSAHAVKEQQAKWQVAEGAAGCKGSQWWQGLNSGEDEEEVDVFGG